MRDIVLENGSILVDARNPRVTPHARTLIKDHLLAEVNSALFTPGQGAKIIDCSGCLIIPGLVNAHCHAAMSMLRGLADDLPLDRWLNDYIFPAEAKHANPRFVYLGTKLSAVEMALNGITTFADGYFHMEFAARAASEVGLRAVIAQGALDVPAPDAPEAGAWRGRVMDFLAAAPDDPLITPAVFCHSPYLCGPDTLTSAADICRESGLSLFTHVSETMWEVEEIVRLYGMRPVEHLHALGLLGSGLVAVHGVHLSSREMELLAQSQTGLIHCPKSNMKLASGAAPVRDLIGMGTHIGIGTDGAASNNILDLFEEMRFASLMSKLVTGDPEALSASTALTMATVGGAEALGMATTIGTLESGKLADVVVMDLDRAHTSPMYDPVSHLVYAARGSDVRDVLVNGELVVRNGQIVTVDLRDLLDEVSSLGREIGLDLGVEMNWRE